jgi:YD repeat-containing protein
MKPNRGGGDTSRREGSPQAAAMPRRVVAVLLGILALCSASGLAVAGAADSAPSAPTRAGEAQHTQPEGGLASVAGNRLGSRGPGPTVPEGAVAVPSMFTATSRTYKSPRGVLTTTLYGEPVNVREAGGAWKPIGATGSSLTAQSGASATAVTPNASVSTNAAHDCALASNSPTTSICNATTDTVGYDGTNTNNSLVEFELKEAVPAGANVLNAQLGMYLSSSTTSTPVSVSAYAATKAWTLSATWNTYDGSHAWTSPGGDFLTANTVANPAVTTPAGWAHWYPTQIVQEWVNGTLPNDGLLLADTTQKTTKDMLRFNSLDASSNHPYLTISWTPRGQEDPSAYRMQPFATDSGSTTKVNVASGDVFVTSTDMSVAGTGPPLLVEHNYDSLNTEGGTVNPWYSIPGASVYADGSVALGINRYDYAPFIRQPSGTFLTPRGVDATLCAVNGTTCKGNAVDGSSAAYALTFNHDGNGPLYRSGYKVTFGATGGILSDADSAGNAIVYHFGSKGIESISNPQGRTFARSFYKLKNGHEVTAAWTDTTSKTKVSYEYDSSDHLSVYTDGESHQTRYAYDEESELKEITDPAGRVTKLNYDSAHRIKTITGPEVNGRPQIWQYVYYEVGQAPSPCSPKQKGTLVTGPEGHVYAFCANVWDEVEKVSQQGAVLGDGPSTTIDYSAYDDEIPAAVNAVNGNAILASEDLFFPNADDVFAARTLNTLSQTPTALGPGWQQNWGPDVTLLAEPNGSYVFVDPSAYRETFTPNGAGGYVPVDVGFGTLTAASGTWVLATSGGDAYTFNSSGTLTTYEDANGGRFLPSYTTINGAQRLASIQDPGGTTTTTKYNGDATLAEVVTPAGEHFYYEYVAAGEPGVRLLAKVTNATTGITTTIAYSTSTWLPSEITLPDGHITRLTYDWANRIAAIEQVDAGTPPSDVTTTITYAPPSSTSCEPADIGQTTVGGGQDEGEQTYCYNAAGQVTNPYGGD